MLKPGKMKGLVVAAKRFLRDEQGTEIVEWAIVGGLVVAVGAAVFVTIGTDAKTALDSLSESVSDAAGS
jgi:pilus assembly protein Flp/PilA